jgi:hypothetical protein
VRAGRLALIGLGCALSLSESQSHARDANQVQTLVIGRSAALATCEGLAASNDNRARMRFPTSPELTLRIRLAGGIGQPPASDAAGNLIIVHSEPRLSKLDAALQTVWTERLPSEASSAPVLTSNGSILIVTRAAEALLFSTAGKLEQRSGLPFADPRRHALAIPTASAGALLASGRDLLQIDRAGQIVRQARGHANITALVEAGSDLVAIGEDGSVERAHATGDFVLVGSFSGVVSDGAALMRGQVLAVVAGHEWRALDLSTGRVTVLASDPALSLSGPLALFETGGAALIGDRSFVSLRGADGRETLRVALSAASQAPNLGQASLHAARVITDTAGAVAAVQSGNDALLQASDGRTLRLEGTSCLDPFRPTPTPSGLVFTCRSGQVFAVADKGH